MGLHIEHDWRAVLGEMVEIRKSAKIVRTGRVDAVTSEGAILWLAADGVQQRGMIQRVDGFEVWIRYKWESD